MIIKSSFKPLVITALTVFSLNAMTAYAATGIQGAIPVAKALNGNQKDDGWYNLGTQSATRTVDGNVITNIPGNSGYGPAIWPTPIASQVKSYTSDSTASLNKASGGTGPYPATDSLYALSFSSAPNAKNGTLGVFESNAVASLANVVFQVEIGSAYGYDFYQSGNSSTPVSALQVGSLSNFSNYAPKLNFTYGGSQVSLVANWAELSAQSQNGTIPVDGTEEPVYINLYAFQWDLTGYSNISSFNITFDVVSHSQTYATRLTQSDVFNQVVAVPEPESYAMLLAGLGLIGFAARRRQA